MNETLDTNQFTPAFGSFIDFFEKANTLSSKAKTMIGVERKKFDNKEQQLFDDFITKFIANHYHDIDANTLNAIINSCSDVEHLDYSNVPLPLEQVETTPNNFIQFGE